MEDLNLYPKDLNDGEVLGSHPVDLMSLKHVCFSSLSEFEGPVMDNTFEGFVVGNL